MVMHVLDESDETWIYNEAPRNAAFVRDRIRPDPVIAELIRNAPAPVVVFKPLCDSQWTDRLLDTHPNSKALWIYRDYTDVASSAVRHWGEHQLDVVRQIADGSLEDTGWRAERMAPDTLATVRRLVAPDLSATGAAALKWYFRNKLFFDLGLADRSDVLLVKYEDLVLAPVTSFSRIFAFTGSTFEERFSKTVFSSSVGRAADIGLPDSIEHECATMLARLESVYEKR